MKTAIVITGNLRTWMNNKESFIKTFNPLNPDIFISTYNLLNGFHPNVASQHNAWEDYVVDKQMVVDSFSGLNVLDILVEDYRDVNEILRQEDPKFHPLLQNLNANCFGQYRKIKQAMNMVKTNEEKNGFKYDRIIKTRCDLAYIDNPDLSITDNNFVYDQGSNAQNEFGSDHLLIGSRNTMFNVTDFCYNEFYNPVYEDSQIHPPHGFLRNAIRYHNLERNPRHIIKYLLRSDGHEQTI